MQRRGALAIAWVGFAALVILHFDFWRPQHVQLHGGFFPGEIGYRLLWMAAAWGFLLFICSHLWEERG